MKVSEVLGWGALPLPGRCAPSPPLSCRDISREIGCHMSDPDRLDTHRLSPITRRCRKSGIAEALTSPCGEMSGRTEGGAKERSRRSSQRRNTRSSTPPPSSASSYDRAIACTVCSMTYPSVEIDNDRAAVQRRAKKR